MVGGRACGDNITAKRSSLLKDAVSVCLCACDTVLCTVKLHNANSCRCMGLCSRWLNTNAKTDTVTSLCAVHYTVANAHCIVGGVGGWGGGSVQ